ncbi:MAG: hypothetical protein HGA46_06260 [Chlorobiaceae bacterium]|nr:hypothetical protein [Chlorobiaceae bacterium]
MKWPLKIIAVLLMLALLVPASAWIFFPWYAQSLIDRALEGKPFRVQVSGAGIPLPGSIGFRSVKLVFTTPPDNCITTATTYTLNLGKGRLLWRTDGEEKGIPSSIIPHKFQADLILEADSLQLVPDPENFIFEDDNPRIRIKITILRNKGLSMEFYPLDVTYNIANAAVNKEKLHLSGLNYRIHVSRAEGWQQPVDTLTVAKLYSDGNPSPIGNFSALFGSKRDPMKPCSLILSNCSVDLFQWNATSENIEYDLKEQKTRFTLNLAEIPLNELPGFKQNEKKSPGAEGTLSGTIPIEFQDSTVLVRNAVVIAGKGATVIYYTSENKPWFSLNLEPRKRSGELLKNLNASIILNSRNRNLSGIAVQNFSTDIFEGTLNSSPFLFDPVKKEMMMTLTLNNIRLPDRLSLHGESRGTFSGGVSGTIPVIYGKKGLLFGNIRLVSTINFKDISLSSLPGLDRPGTNTPFASGNIHGIMPIELRDSTLLIRKGMVEGEKNSRIIFYDKKNQPLLSFDLGTKKESGRLFKNLNGAITFININKKNAAIDINNLSTEMFGGTINATPFTFGNAGKSTSMTVKLRNINALDRVKLYGDFKAALKGDITGTIPLSIGNKGFSISKARLLSKGGGTITIAPKTRKQTTTERIMGATKPDTDYLFSEPDLWFSRSFDGAFRTDFTLKKFTHRNSGGELLLSSPKGSLSLWQNKKNPELITLENFSAGFFDGTIGIEKADYDMAKKSTETTIALNGIPIQKLLDLQGAKKIYATGSLKGKLPVRIKDQVFEIIDGGMAAEQNGQIIYATTPEERAAANQGLRTTYEALSNFLYAELFSSIIMAPDGKSHLNIQLKGANPDYQAGRPIELNLNIEQNLLDLMRSLSISGNLEQVISEKALNMGN